MFSFQSVSELQFCLRMLNGNMGVALIYHIKSQTSYCFICIKQSDSLKTIIFESIIALKGGQVEHWIQMLKMAHRHSHKLKLGGAD